MNRFRSLHLRAGVVVAFAAAVVISASALVAFATTGDTKPVKKKLTGQELYAINCNRCHAERYATERTPAQWKTLMLHMRTRAQIPAAQAKEILKYLQEDAGK
jgi:mono/diheme cytochrome c family protein